MAEKLMYKLKFDCFFIELSKQKCGSDEVIKLRHFIVIKENI